MARFSFFHAADLHIDSPFVGLAALDDDVAARLRAANRRAFGRLVDAALAQAVDFIVIAGDVYDGDWPGFETGLFFNQQARRLANAGIAVYLLHGNHDAASVLTRTLTLPANVHRFAAERPQTFVRQDLGVALHGQSFTRPDVRDNLVAAYPPPVRGCYNIGVLHTALDGREGHSPYAPCSVADLLARGYDYWALGHVHAREIVHENPWVVFPGNLQGRHIRESGGKGFTRVTVDGGRSDIAALQVAEVRWERVAVDLAGTEDWTEMTARVETAVRRCRDGAPEPFLIVRLQLTGATRLDGELRNDFARAHAECRGALDAGGGGWLEKLAIETTPLLDLDTVRARADALGALLRAVDEAVGDEAALGDLAEELKPILMKLPAPLRGQRAPGGTIPPERLGELIAEARALLAGLFDRERPGE